MGKLMDLGHLEAASLAAKGLIGEVAGAMAEALEEVAAAGQDVVRRREITAEEYAALSEEDKQAAVVYEITDGESESGDGESAPTVGVLSFNGRRGDVMPGYDDYTAEMVGADPAGSARDAMKYAQEAADKCIPAGCILIWSGAANAVPKGWAICDGANGTPDLRGRFVIGADREVTSYSFSSNNQKVKSSTASIVFTAKKDIVGIKLTYSVQSEANYDKLSFWRDSTQVGSDISGNPASGTLAFGDLAAGQTMKFKYAKDSSTDTGSDTATVSEISFTSGGMTVELSEDNIEEYFDLSYPDSYKFEGSVKTTPAQYPVGGTGGEQTHKLTTSEMPSHSHSSSHRITGTGTTPTSSTQRFTSSSSTSAYTTTSISSGSSGGGSAHNNMPPYYALCFIMKL